MPGKGVIGLRVRTSGGYRIIFIYRFFYRLHIPVATMDDPIEEILAELPDPVPEGQQFTDLDDQVPPPPQ